MKLLALLITLVAALVDGRRWSTSFSINERALSASATKINRAIRINEGTGGRGSNVMEVGATTSSIQQPTYQEMRSHLSPVAGFVADSIGLTFNTAASGFSSGMIGYIFGAVVGVPKIFRGGSGIGSIHRECVRGFKSWGVLGSCFTGFGGGTKIIRGGKEDKWNSVCASCATGAYLARKRGPAEMAKGCAGYAGITLLFENMGAGGKKSSEEGEVVRNVME